MERLAGRIEVDTGAAALGRGGEFGCGQGAGGAGVVFVVFLETASISIGIGLESGAMG